MSFGFGVGDFLAVIKLANDIRKDFADAPEQFQQIAAEVGNLQHALVDVTCSAQDVPEAQKNNLSDLCNSCRNVLEAASNLRSEYSSLDSKGGSVHERTKRAWKRVKWEPDDIRDLRGRITANIVALNSFTGANIRDTVFKLEERQARQENEEILEWLTTFDTTAQQADSIRQRQTGTGQWLLDSPEYTKWKATKGDILFCHGIPGAGKTVLSSIVVENLLHDLGIEADVAICYFYFNFKRQGEQTFENVILSLLKQLGYASSSVPDDIQTLVKQCKSTRRRPNREEIIKTIHSVAGSFSRVLIVVDALDECQTSNGCQRELISHLTELQRTAGANILATSRPVPHIVERFKGFESVEVLASEGDIRRYIESNLEHLPRFVSRDQNLQNEIKEGITKAVDGMFLLAKLHLDSLMGKRSPRALRQTLNTLAKGTDAYDEAYQNTMLRISGQLPGQKELAMSTLMWIVHAKRPLSTTELRHALGVEIGELELSEDNLPDLDDMVSVCCGLVTIDGESSIIRLIHYTTQEFFDRHGDQYFPDAEAQITDICVTYLAFDEFEKGPCQTKEDFKLRLANFPLYGYSSQFWGQHAYSHADSEFIWKFLNRPSHVETCGHSLTILKRLSGQRGDFWMFESTCNMTGLHLAAYFGLFNMVSRILNGFLDPDVQDSSFRTPIWYAVYNDHQDVVRQLLERTCRLDAEDVDKITPLQVAAYNGHEAMVRLLLDKGAQVDYADRSGRTPLCWAAFQGSEAVVRLLLDKGAYIDHAFEDGRTPLWEAAHEGSEAMVRLLLDKGAQIDYTDKYGRTPLWQAAVLGREAVVRLLLDQGADINSRTLKDGSTLLIHAAKSGRLNILKLLLDAKADHKITDIYNRSALTYAIIWNRPEAIDALLLQDGLDPNITDHWGSVVLSFAARFGTVSVFRKIAALPNVDILAQDCFGRTPLWWARKQRHDNIVREIIEHQRFPSHDNTDAHAPVIGEPVEFRERGGHCDVCRASLQYSWFQCGDCADGQLDICQECHRLGARCLVESHQLSLNDPYSEEDWWRKGDWDVEEDPTSEEEA